MLRSGFRLWRLPWRRRGGRLRTSSVNVVCYEKLVNGIDEIIKRGHVNLVETLAERIIDMCLNQENVISARVRIEKLDVLENAESVGVEVERFNT